MNRRALVDAGPLVALLTGQATDWQAWAVNQLTSRPVPLFTCDAVLAEAAHLLGGPAPLLRMMNDHLLVTQFDSQVNAVRLERLVRKYADLPMDFADACLLVMAEQHPEAEILTFDRRDFGVYRLSNGRPVRFAAPPVR
ncbi:MAG: PIN domain-containing protein [Verrucomicrobiales bacterium]|nr:PIN domain-containing protein [Verrucomicrobiales bacterium]MCP5519875.1 PIN domain-containing protein [Verrucomicrobiales bacterium]MCP5526808.1 PIN domain-containing protein [Verrucomicrobiales bacterium]